MRDRSDVQLLHRTPDCAALLQRPGAGGVGRLLRLALEAAAVPPASFAVGNATGTFALDLSSHGGRTVAAYLLEANRRMRKRLELCWCGPRRCRGSGSVGSMPPPNFRVFKIRPEWGG